jgi:two-component system response regulator YesN
MINILILDDEKQERELIKYLLRTRDNLNITEGNNGKEALKILETQRIDVLITDVKMPFMNGTELAEYAKIKQPHIKILFFSGHDDFEHVKTAMLVGATTYILKPIQPEEFNNSINQILNEINIMNAVAESDKKRDEVLETHILRELINDVSVSALRKRFPFVGFSFLNQIKLACLVHVYTSHQLFTEKLDALRKAYTFIHYFSTSSNQVIIYFTNPIQMEKAKEIIGELDRSLPQVFTFQFTPVIRVLDDINLHIYQAEKILEEKVFYHRAYNDPENNKKVEEDREDTLFQLLIQSIKEVDEERFNSTLDELIRFHMELTHLPISLVRFSYARLIGSLVDDLNIQFDEPKEKLIGRIIEANQYQEIVEVLKEVQDNLQSYFKSLESTKNGAILTIKKYILNHYEDDLYLELLADIVSLSPRYLSELFKKEEGIGINKYIRQIRMEKAKLLLETKHLKVVEIAESVGYSNYSYFVKTFREVIGLPPEKYRQKVLHSD